MKIWNVFVEKKSLLFKHFLEKEYKKIYLNITIAFVKMLLLF